jgi:cellulose synthase operon protein C
MLFSMRFLCLVLLVLALTSTPRAAWGQDGVDANVQRLQLAESFMRAGQHERAVALLEQLYASDPTSFVVFDRLRAAYESVKRYDDAIAMTNRRIAESPTPVLYADIARYHHLKGDEAGAERYWQEAVRFAPANRSTYQVVYRSMLDVRRLDLAIETLRQGRSSLGDASAFRGELATLLGMTGRFDEAMDENVALLRDDPRQLNAITSRLGRITEQPEALESAVRKVSLAVRAEPLNRQLRELLSWLYLEAGDYDGAFEESRAIDALEEQEGRLLLTFAQRAIEAGAFDAARRAYDEVTNRHDQGAAAVHARLGVASLEKTLGDSFTEKGETSRAREHYERALGSFREFLTDFPAHPSEPQVLREVGLIEKNVRVDLDAAADAFSMLATRHPRSSEAEEAQLELGRIEVLRGDLDSARLLFERLIDQLRIGDIAERARFEIALVHFYRGEFESARAMTDVLDVNTSTDVANDAIELKVVISENRGPDSLHTPLRAYASALLLERQGRSDEATEVLDKLIAQYGRHRIADEARFARAEARLSLEDARAAFEGFTEVSQYHPDSHLADRALFRAAEIQHRYFDDAPAAVETLTRMLTQYPGSLLAPEARTTIRRLRGEAL